MSYEFLSNCPNHDAFAKAQELAMAQPASGIANRVGVWSQSGLETPWDYRRRQREK
ncbi:MAG: hypothetical protein KA716_32080 [Gloeotrichia echinulata DEX184]|nr:hypothetical protein [Gloeotrichia echinulata DEX184]